MWNIFAFSLLISSVSALIFLICSCRSSNFKLLSSIFFIPFFLLSFSASPSSSLSSGVSLFDKVAVESIAWRFFFEELLPVDKFRSIVLKRLSSVDKSVLSLLFGSKTCARLHPFWWHFEDDGDGFGRNSRSKFSHQHPKIVANFNTYITVTKGMITESLLFTTWTHKVTMARGRNRKLTETWTDLIFRLHVIFYQFYFSMSSLIFDSASPALNRFLSVMFDEN